MHFLTTTNLDFMGQRKVAFLFSLTLILISIVSLVIHGGPRYGIDFLGGIQLRLNFQKDVNVGDVRQALLAAGFQDPAIKKLAGESEKGTDLLIFLQQEAATNPAGTEVQTPSDNQMDLTRRIEAALAAKFQDNPFQETEKNLVGPKIGHELRNAAIFAIFISLLLILLYISWRFKFNFAVGAIIALFHDVIITLGFFSILNYEISLNIVAAFLTIVGYSLNDTIVVFDRIRENLKLMRKDKLVDIVNKSVNQSLSRTIITSSTTLLVVLFLYFFGGEVIKYFAFAMLVGIIIGTYSSIYVASPILVELDARAEDRRLQRLERA
ncbi:protein translocase subunit SecF [candidate division KSB1 bacterium]|nr:protein translocase subunit SecF [candidate division KSB1 bacterium]